MPTMQGTVSGVSVKEMPQPDQFGNTHRLNACLSDVWYSFGSNKGGGYVNKDVPDLASGDEIEFMFVENGDFKNVKRATVQRSAKGTGSPPSNKSATPSGSSHSSSPNPAAVGQVLNILLDSGATLDSILTMDEGKLLKAISDVEAAKARISSLSGKKPPQKPAQQEPEDEIPF